MLEDTLKISQYLLLGHRYAASPGPGVLFSKSSPFFFPRLLPLYSADGGNTFLRNAGTHPSKYMKLDPRRQDLVLSNSLLDERRFTRRTANMKMASGE